MSKRISHHFLHGGSSLKVLSYQCICYIRNIINKKMKIVKKGNTYPIGAGTKVFCQQRKWIQCFAISMDS